jgi:hypothetical protein
VVTTRRRDAALSGPGRTTIEVGVFAAAQAVAYLRAKLAVYGRTASDADLTELADVLGHLPIALAQAVAYQIDTGLDCSAYLRRLADGRRTLATLVPDEQGLPDEQRRGLAAVWSWSIQHADTLPPAGLARPLLELASVLDPNGIPLSVLTSGPAVRYLRSRRAEAAGARADAPAGADNTGAPVDVGPAILPAISPDVDPESAEDALHCLRRVSLATVDGDRPDQIVRVHALVQRTVRESLGPVGVDRAVAAAADAVADAWPVVLEHYAPAPLLDANVKQLRRHGTDDPLLRAGHDVLLVAGWGRSAYRFAEVGIGYWEELATQAGQRLGPDHPYTLLVRHELADMHGQLGHYAAACEEFEALIPRCRAVLGPDHFETLSGRHALLTWRGFAGDPAGAAAAAADLAADWERTAGPDSPEPIAARQSRGLWQARSGDTIGAIRYYQDLAALVRERWGTEHFMYASMLPYLEHWQILVHGPSTPRLRRPDRLSEYLAAAPPDHGILLVSRSVAALWRGRGGDFAASAAELRDVLADYHRIGPNHFDALIARYHLAELTGRAGDPISATAAFEDLISHLIPRFGGGHPLTLLSRHAQTYWSGTGQGTDRAPADTAARYETLATDFRRALPPGHPETAAVQHNLACWRARAGDAPGALALLDDVLPELDRIHTTEHPRARTARRNRTTLADGGPAADLHLIEPSEPHSHVSLSTSARIRHFHASRGGG